MRKLVIALFLLTVIILAQNSNVYSPDQVLIPKYRIKQSPDGTYRVYDSKQVLVPKWIVNPDSKGDGYKIYDSNRSLVIPEFHTKGGTIKLQENGF